MIETILSHVEKKRRAFDQVHCAEVYWESLANSRFLLVPEGTGVQTPKVRFFVAFYASILPLSQPRPAAEQAASASEVVDRSGRSLKRLLRLAYRISFLKLPQLGNTTRKF